MIVYLARDIPAFVMYCVNGDSGSSLLIASTDSMIVRNYQWGNILCLFCHQQGGENFNDELINFLTLT